MPIPTVELHCQRPQLHLLHLINIRMSAGAQELQASSQGSSLASVSARDSISWANWLSCLYLRLLWQQLMALLTLPLRWYTQPSEKQVCALLAFRHTHFSSSWMAALQFFSLRYAWARLVRIVSVTQQLASGLQRFIASLWQLTAYLNFFCLQQITPSSEQMRGSEGLISKAFLRERVAVLRLLVRRYSMPMQRWAWAHPGNSRTMVRQMDMAWSDSSCTAKECAIPTQAQRKFLFSMMAFWKYLRATSYFLQWKQQVPTENQLTGCDEQFSTRLCAQQQRSPVSPRSNRQVTQMGRISKHRGSFRMAFRHSSWAAGISQFWQWVLALMHSMSMLSFWANDQKMVYLRGSSSTITGFSTVSSIFLILAVQIFFSHWSSGAKSREASSLSFSVPEISWQSTNLLNASKLVGSFCRQSLQLSTAIFLFSRASQHSALMRALQLSIFRLKYMLSSWISRTLRHCSYCLLRSRERAARSWKLTLRPSTL